MQRIARFWQLLIGVDRLQRCKNDGNFMYGCELLRLRVFVKSVKWPINNRQHLAVQSLTTVTPKSAPPKIGPAGPILTKKPSKSGPPDHFLLPKSVRPDQFWLGRTNFANFGPPSLLFPILHYRAISPRDLHRKL